MRSTCLKVEQHIMSHKKSLSQLGYVKAGLNCYSVYCTPADNGLVTWSHYGLDVWLLLGCDAMPQPSTSCARLSPNMEKTTSWPRLGLIPTFGKITFWSELGLTPTFAEVIFASNTELNPRNPKILKHSGWLWDVQIDVTGASLSDEFRLLDD